jgi:hypothetical protein
VRHFLNRVRVHQFQWDSEFGVGDAAITGQITGAAWMLKGTIIGMIGYYMDVEIKPRVTITPHFQGFVSYTKLRCMISFRLGHAMIAGLMIIKHWKRRPKLFQSSPVEKTTNV